MDRTWRILQTRTEKRYLIVTKSKELWGSTSWSFLTRSEIKDVNQFPHLTTRTTWKYITWGNFWDTLYNNLCLWRMPSDKMVQLVEMTTKFLGEPWWAECDEWWRLVVYLYLKFSIIIIMSLLSLSVQFCLFKSTQWRLVTTPVPTWQPRYLRQNPNLFSVPRATFLTLRPGVIWRGLMWSNMVCGGVVSGLWWGWATIWKWPIFTLKVELGGVWYIYEAEPEPTGNSAIWSKRKWQLRWFTTVENSRGPTLIGSTA